MLFLGHNLVEIFSHHCLRITLEDSRRELEARKIISRNLVRAQIFVVSFDHVVVDLYLI